MKGESVGDFICLLLWSRLWAVHIKLDFGFFQTFHWWLSAIQDSVMFHVGLIYGCGQQLIELLFSLCWDRGLVLCWEGWFVFIFICIRKLHNTETALLRLDAWTTILFMLH